MGDLLPGQLAYFFYISILDAALLSWLTLHWYRRSVRRLMQKSAPPRPAEPLPAPGPPSPRVSAEALEDSPSSRGAASGDGIASRSLRFAIYDADSNGTLKRAWRDARPTLRSLALAYGLGAAAYAAVIAALELGRDAFHRAPVVWFVEWWVSLWPIGPTLVLVLVLNRSGVIRIATGYIATGAIGAALLTLGTQLTRGVLTADPFRNAYLFLLALAATAYLPLALIVVTGWRRIRTVMPVALAATLVFGLGLMFFREALQNAFNHPAARAAILNLAVATSTEIAFYGLFMVVALPVGWLAWRLLRGLAAGFEHKRFSDIQLVVDCWWLVVTVDRVIGLTPQYGIAAIPLGSLAFLAYRLVVAVVLRRRPPVPSTAAQRLLLLRVFGYETRTESLFDRVAQQWRFRGAVQLIAGVDLATRTADPGDLLRFLHGGLDEAYVAAPEDIARRLEGLDLRPDPDGRFRVNEVYCHNDTWHATFQQILDSSEAVLTDLRSFSRQNAGCIFELEQLVRRVPTDHIVVVYNEATDLGLLATVLSQAWDGARADGLARGAGDIALVRVEAQSRPEVAVLMDRLRGEGAPGRVLNAAEVAT